MFFTASTICFLSLNCFWLLNWILILFFETANIYSCNSLASSYFEFSASCTSFIIYRKNKGGKILVCSMYLTTRIYANLWQKLTYNFDCFCDQAFQWIPHEVVQRLQISWRCCYFLHTWQLCYWLCKLLTVSESSSSVKFQEGASLKNIRQDKIFI